MTVYKTMDEIRSAEFSEKEISALIQAAESPVTDDEDCPELTDEQIARIKKQKRGRPAQFLTLRLSQKGSMQARALGENYAEIISRIVEDTLHDPEKLRHYL